MWISFAAALVPLSSGLSNTEELDLGPGTLEVKSGLEDLNVRFDPQEPVRVQVADGKEFIHIGGADGPRLEVELDAEEMKPEAVSISRDDAITSNEGRQPMIRADEQRDGSTETPERPSHPWSTEQFLESFRVCGECAHGGEADMKRVGEAQDGGYVVCRDADRGVGMAFSIGINGFDGWGEQISRRFRVPVHEYDCTNANRPACAQGGCDLHFYSICVDDGSQSRKSNFRTLEALVNAAGAGARTDLLLKMDVEGAEWGVLRHVDPAVLRRFRQIVLEIHGVEAKWAGDRLGATQALAALLADFTVVHTHGNDWSFSESYLGQYRLPDVIEVTLVRKDLVRPTACVNQHYDAKLDVQNNPHGAWPAGMPIALPQVAENVGASRARRVASRRLRRVVQGRARGPRRAPDAWGAGRDGPRLPAAWASVQLRKGAGW